MEIELKIFSVISLWLSGFILGFTLARYIYKNNTKRR